jgi:hypothetical protein
MDSPSPSICNDVGICQSQHLSQFNGTSSKSPNYRDTSDSLGKQRVKRRPSDRVESPHVSGSLTIDGPRFVVEDQEESICQDLHLNFVSDIPCCDYEWPTPNVGNRDEGDEDISSVA